jgi:hypothetical protein
MEFIEIFLRKTQTIKNMQIIRKSTWQVDSINRRRTTMTMMKLCKNRIISFPLRRLLSTEGYKSIGSFHSEDVDELMKQTEDVYEVPSLPFNPKCLKADIEFDGIRDSSDFLLDREKWTFLNHGAFGAALKVGYDRAEQWRYVWVFDLESSKSLAHL